MVRLDDLVQFVLDHLQYEDEEIIKQFITGHLMYGTLEYGEDAKGITHMVRYNIIEEFCDVLDMAVREDLKGVKFIKAVLANAWLKWPTVKYIKFTRYLKEGYEKPRIYKITEFLNIREK